MTLLDGARIYFEGTSVDHKYHEKIRQIVTTVKSFSPCSEISMRFLKNGNVYEGLLWGKASGSPLGIYNRGHSMSHVLDTTYRKVKKECLKVWKMKGIAKSKKTTDMFRHTSPMNKSSTKSSMAMVA